MIEIDTARGRGNNEIPVYEYLVKLSTSETVAVISEFSAHEVGECVKVFFSSRPSYPRLAISTACL